MLTNDFHVSTVFNLVDKIKPILATHGPDTQGAVIADLFAAYLAGHRPKGVREDIIELWMETVRDLLAAYDDEIC